jgi:hypothetical protein
MNTRAERVRTATDVDLGPSRFMTYQPPDILRPWDGRHWGTYKQP